MRRKVSPWWKVSGDISVTVGGVSGVGVGVGVGVVVGVTVVVGVAVSTGVGVGVAAGVAVGVGVGVPPQSNPPVTPITITATIAIRITAITIGMAFIATSLCCQHQNCTASVFFGSKLTVSKCLDLYHSFSFAFCQ